MSVVVGDEDALRVPASPAAHWQVTLDEAVLDRIRAHVMRAFSKRGGLSRFLESEDVVQEVALRMLKRTLESEQTPELTGRELLALEVHRAICDLYRGYFGRNPRRARAAFVPLDAEIRKRGCKDEAPAAAELFDCETLWTSFYRHVQQLSKPDRIVFDLIWSERRSQKEAADRIGVTTRTIRNRWMRIRQKLAPVLQELLDN